MNDIDAFIAAHPERVTRCPTAYCWPTQAARSTPCPKIRAHTARESAKVIYIDRRKNGWTHAQICILKRTYLSGVPFAEIAKAIGRSMSACKAKVKSLRLSRRLGAG